MSNSPTTAPHEVSKRGRIGGLLGLVYLLAKFGKIALLLLKGSKFAATGISMVVTVGLYAMFWGWPFAVGFVALLFVHEMGHAIQLRREGIATSPIVFVPFMGAVIAMKEMPKDAAMEARVGLAGPILGTVGVLACWALAIAAGGADEAWGQLLLALAYTGAFLNLFNLLPISPLDGGRAMAAVSAKLWVLGLIIMCALPFVFGPNPILILILIIGGFETWRRIRERNSDDPEHKRYYNVSPQARRAVFLTYICLAALLVYTMQATFIDIDQVAR